MAIYVNRGQAKTFICRRFKCWVGMGSKCRKDPGSICPGGAVQGSEGPECVIIPTAPEEREGRHGK